MTWLGNETFVPIASRLSRLWPQKASRDGYTPQNVATAHRNTPHLPRQQLPLLDPVRLSFCLATESRASAVVFRTKFGFRYDMYIVYNTTFSFVEEIRATPPTPAIQNSVKITLCFYVPPRSVCSIHPAACCPARPSLPREGRKETEAENQTEIQAESEREVITSRENHIRAR